MKKLLFSLLLLLLAGSAFSQGLLNRGLIVPLSMNLQLGVSPSFGAAFSKPTLIPNPGLDLNYGLIGFRVTGQFFNTAPALDFASYLGPVTSGITQSNLKENNSNLLTGFTPYLSIGKGAVSLEAGFGFKHLTQTSASLDAVYAEIPSQSILKYPVGDPVRTVWILEPNIRAMFGKSGNPVRFFIEGAYAFPSGMNEFSYITRGDLTKILDPRTGMIDPKALEATKPVTGTGRSMSGFMTIGAGITVNLSQPATPSVNNYGINDEGIKRTTEQPSVVIHNYGCCGDVPQSATMRSGGYVTGRGVIVGGAGAAYRIGNRSTDIIYESDVTPEAALYKKKNDKNLTVNGTTSMNGMVSIASSDPMRLVAPGGTGNAGYVSPDSSIRIEGEPVPGAEIYIELEPDDEPHHPSEGLTGVYRTMINVPASTDTRPRYFEMSVLLTETSFPRIEQQGRVFVGSGIYIFGVVTSINGKVSYNQFAVVVNEPTTEISIYSGPFSQSISNIEDNGRMINPQLPSRVDFETRLFLVNSFTSVNNYGINDEGIK